MEGVCSNTEKSLTLLSKNLLTAAQVGDNNELQNLLTQGASLTSDSLGTSALHFACKNGHRITAEMLIRAGASANARSKVDKTPMHFAAQYGHHEIVKLLAKHGADINAKDMLQMTPLHWAVTGQHFLVVKFLLESDAESSNPNKFGKTAMDIAEEKCNFHIIDCLKKTLGGQFLTDENVDVSPGPGSTTTDTSPLEALASLWGLGPDIFPWLQSENNSTAAVPSSVLLEGASVVTLTEAGKRAMQHWSNPSFTTDTTAEDLTANSKDDEDKTIEVVMPSNGSKMLSITVPQHLVGTPSNESVTCTAHGNRLSNKRRSVSDDELTEPAYKQPRIPNVGITPQELLLQMNLGQAQTEIENSKRRIKIKEQEVNVWKKRLEILQRSRNT